MFQNEKAVAYSFLQQKRLSFIGIRSLDNNN